MDTHASGRLFKECLINLDFYLKDANNLDYQRSKILREVEKYLLNNYMLPDENGVPTCNVTLVNGNTPWGIESTKVYGGMTIEIKVLYEQNLFDPYSSGIGVTATHSDHGQALFSLRDQVTGALVHNLNIIRKSSGYNKNLYTDQNRDSFSYEVIKNFPFANVISRNEVVTSQGQDRWVKKTLSYTIDAYLRNVNKINEDIEDILADVEYRMMNNYVLPDVNGNRTCTECYFTFNKPFGIESTQPSGGVQIGMDIFYRQDLENPALPSTSIPAVGGFGAGGYGENPWGY
jgi:hypothetical protein